MEVSDPRPGDDLTPATDDQRDALGRILGLDGPVPESVLIAAVEHEDYARNLLLCRREPELLHDLIARPPHKRRLGPVELAARGSRALARWAATGFTTVDDATYQRRMSACVQCPELSGQGSDRPVCSLCGCQVVWKARMTSENCPAASPDDPSLTRWGEPVPADEVPSAQPSTTRR
jgi:hypothetical protein